MENHKETYGWANIDHVEASGYFLDYLNTATGMEFFQEYKQESYAWIDAGEGHHILDVGCGAGDDALALAQIVGPAGRVVGIDNSEMLIAEAQKKAEGLNLPVEFQLGDAQKLCFSDNTFSGCRSDRVFQHLPDREKALAEMIRVTRPGARIAVNDADWETLIVDSPNKGLTRKIMNYFCDITRNGWGGRQLPALFKKAGLFEIVIYPKNLMLTDFAQANLIFSLEKCVKELQNADEISIHEGTEWLEGLEKASQDNLFFSAVTGFGVCGRKP